MWSRCKTYLAWVGALLVLGLAGTLAGMGVRAWVIPRLKPLIAQFTGTTTPTKTKSKTGEREVAFWKSTMIPNFVSPKPGVDPMGMKLVPVYEDELGQEQYLTLSHQTMQNIGLRTTPVVSHRAKRTMRTVGQVTYAEPLLGDVSLKIDGWVDKLYVNYVGQRVKKGQPLFDLYSPELVTAQEEYLLGFQTGAKELPGFDQVFPAYDKLRYWDVPKSEIAAIKRAGRAKKDIRFVSPFDGWVIDRDVYEGSYKKAGQRLYRIADLSKMWVYVYLYEYQVPMVREGQQARLTLPYDPGQVLEGKVIYVYPYVNPKTRQLRVRLEFPNPKLRMKAQMYANVEIVAQSKRPELLVPLDALIYTGQHKKIDGVDRRVGWSYVQVKHGKFEPHQVVLGEEVEDGNLQIISGLKEGDEVVVVGQFLLDSERKTKAAILKMFEETRAKSATK